MIRQVSELCQPMPPPSADRAPINLCGRSELARWRADVTDMVASNAEWQLVLTFNEWREGTSVESAREWETPSGYGAYLDTLHELLP